MRENDDDTTAAAATSSDETTVVVPTDPLEWTSEHVKSWLAWCENKFGLKLTGCSSEEIPDSGVGLCELTRDDFVQRFGAENATILVKHLAHLRSSLTGRPTSPLQPQTKEDANVLDVSNIINDVNLIISMFCQTIINHYLSYNYPRFHRLFIDITMHRIYAPSFQDIDNTARRCSKIILSLVAVSVIVSLTVCLRQQCDDHLIDTDFCGLIFPVYLYVVDMKRMVWRRIWLMVQIITLAHVLIISFLSVMYLVLLANCALAHIDQLKIDVVGLEAMPHVQRVQHMRFLVQYHCQIIKWMNEFKALMSFFFLIFFLGAQVVVSGAFYVIMETGVTMFRTLHCFGYLLVGLTCCLIGQHTINRSESLYDTLNVAIPWDGDVRTQRMLGMMLMKASKALGLYISDFYIINNQLFVIMFKAGYSVLTILMKTRDESR